MNVLVTGAGGQLGRDLVDAFGGTVPAGGRRCSLYGPDGPGPAVDVVGLDHAALPVDDRGAVLAAVDGLRPDVVVHTGAWTAVDACEGDPDRAWAVNALGTRHVAEAAERSGAHLVYVSTDYVFDGRSPRPYVEWDETNPLSAYGRSKLGGERECPPGSTIVRTSWVCGAHGANMVKTALRLGAGDGPLRFVDDQHGCPTFTADLAAAVVTLATDRRPRRPPRDQPGRDDVVRLRPRRPRRRRPRRRSGRADRHRRPRSTPPGAAAGQLRARQRRAPARRLPAPPAVGGRARPAREGPRMNVVA